MGYLKIWLLSNKTNIFSLAMSILNADTGARNIPSIQNKNIDLEKKKLSISIFSNISTCITGVLLWS